MSCFFFLHVCSDFYLCRKKKERFICAEEFLHADRDQYIPADIDVLVRASLFGTVVWRDKTSIQCPGTSYPVLPLLTKKINK